MCDCKFVDVEVLEDGRGDQHLDQRCGGSLRPHQAIGSGAQAWSSQSTTAHSYIEEERLKQRAC